MLIQPDPSTPLSPHELQRIRLQLWCQTYVAYASAANSVTPSRAHLWADQALQDFDTNFIQSNGELDTTPFHN